MAIEMYSFKILQPKKAVHMKNDLFSIDCA